MGGASSYLAMLAIAAFLIATWGATKVSKALGVSDIVLVITTGLVLGPEVLGLISKEYTVCEQLRHVECHDDDLAYKVANHLPLGEALGRIAEMDYCHKEDYHHDDHSVGGDHGDDHQGDTHGDSHGVSHGVSHNGTDDHSDEMHAEMDNHNGTDDHSDEMHAEMDNSSHGHDYPRRLAGGGSYHSYEECLIGSCESDISTQCQLTPDVFTLIGHAGVALMIFESGMHFDFEKAKIVGPPACVVAVFGTFTPLFSGALLTMAYGYPFFPAGISAGTALAPTSVGIALRLLGEANVLGENFGQAIITAAFVDDILSLVLFNVLFSLGDAEFDFVPVVIYPIVGIVFMLLAMYAAMKFWPWFICDFLLPKIPLREGDKVPRTDEALFLMMMVVLLVYGTITYLLGTHLWGCFIAGMTFACLQPPHHAHHVWVRQTKRMTSWMIRIFFACTVAFSIPIAKLMSLEAFWKGSIMGIGPCILTKVCCAPFMGKAKWVIGWAMVGRAEFAYLIAQMAAAAGMLDQELFAIVIWSLLYATVFAPFIFRYVLNKYVDSEGIGADHDAGHEVKSHEFEDDVSVEPTDRTEKGADIDLDYKARMQDLEDIKVNAVVPDVEEGAAHAVASTPAPLDAKGSSSAKCCVPFSRGVM